MGWGLDRGEEWGVEEKLREQECEGRRRTQPNPHYLPLSNPTSSFSCTCFVLILSCNNSKQAS